MGKRIVAILSLLFVLCSTAMAQMHVRGTVVSEGDGMPVIGATVTVVGSNVSTVTDVDGFFSLTLPPTRSM